MENVEDFSAAIPTNEQIKSRLCPEEFQQTLSHWVEEKGILTDLRSRLRCTLINVLRGTAVGRDITRKAVQKNSLLQQALNLIMAEFLIRNECHYTLSVFNTEVGLPNVFGSKINNENLLFDDEDILKIIEVIGIKKSWYRDEILTAYRNGETNCSILVCLINFLSKISIQYDNRSEFEERCSKEVYRQVPFMRKIQNILLLLKIPSQTRKIISENLKKIYLLQIKDLGDKYDSVVDSLKKDILKQNKKIKEVYQRNKELELKLEVNKAKVIDKVVKATQTRQIEPEILLCDKKHCESSCEENLSTIEDLKVENFSLKKENVKQKEEIGILSAKYSELVNRFLECQNTINLLKKKTDGCDFKGSPLRGCNLRQVASDTSSDSPTEEALLETRLVLQKLEEETRIINGKYRTLLFS